MGMNPRHGRWAPAQWRSVAPDVAAIRRAGWPVHAACMVCGLQMKVDLARLERTRGPGFVLWGRTSDCRRLHCPGKVVFMARPPRAEGEVPML